MIILENPVTKSQGQLMLCLVGGIFGGIEPVIHIGCLRESV